MILEPYQPLLTPVAIYALETLVRDKVVFEFGAGGSTPWLYGLAGTFVSVEHDQKWFGAVVDSNPSINIFLVEEENIARVINAYRDEYFDVVFIDCLDSQRGNALQATVPKLKPGGCIVFDDTDRQIHKDQISRSVISRWYRNVVSGKKYRGAGLVKSETTFFFKP